jgi:hypothetical protein
MSASRLHNVSIDECAFRHQQQMATWASTLSIQCTEDYRINLHPKVHFTRNPHTVEEDFRIMQYPEVIYRKKGGRGEKAKGETKEIIIYIAKGRHWISFLSKPCIHHEPPLRRFLGIRLLLQVHEFGSLIGKQSPQVHH